VIQPNYKFPPAHKWPGGLASLVEKNVENWQSGDNVRGLWNHDASLGIGADEADWLG
jgi:hypothetical protein